MFDDINIEINNRLLDAKSVLFLLKNNSIEDKSELLKGVFFVVLYGAIEYTITSVVARCIELLNQTHSKITDLKPSIFALLFNSECESMISARDKKWHKRNELFAKIKDDIMPDIDSLLFPASTGNIKEKQLDIIWKTFGVCANAVNDRKVVSYLSTVAENRNAVAHGRETASDIGGKFSYKELDNIYSAISTFCSYVPQCFEDYINKKDYLKNK